MIEEYCENCHKLIRIERWATTATIRKGNNKGEKKVPVWRHVPQEALGGMCGPEAPGMGASPPAGKVYTE